MFTGIIQNTGIIKNARILSGGGKLSVVLRRLFTRVAIGESIAVNGCCLTVVSYKKNCLEFDVSDETMRKTAFGKYHDGTQVSLERAMKSSERFGGHFVLGHVDGVGVVKAVEQQPGSVRFTISFPREFAALYIDKGSVAVDGISLTVCDLTKSTFNVYVIPHTLKETHLSVLKSGSRVNLECDVLGKYVARALAVKKS